MLSFLFLFPFLIFFFLNLNNPVSWPAIDHIFGRVLAPFPSSSLFLCALSSLLLHAPLHLSFWFLTQGALAGSLSSPPSDSPFYFSSRPLGFPAPSISQIKSAPSVDLPRALPCVCFLVRLSSGDHLLPPAPWLWLPVHPRSPFPSLPIPSPASALHVRRSPEIWQRTHLIFIRPLRITLVAASLLPLSSNVHIL